MSIDDSILDAAIEEFIENGFEGSRTRRIAERAGVAEGTIYNHVSSKRELFETVIIESVNDHLNRVESIELSTDEPASALKELIRSAYENLVAETPMELMRLVLAETHRFPDLAQFYREQVMNRSQQLMQEILRDGIDQGDFRESPIEDFPNILAGPITVLIFNLLMEPERELTDDELEDYMETHLDVILNGLTNNR